MKCENCAQEHDGSYGSGRFCSSKCARSFSSKNNRLDKNKKISISLKNGFSSGKIVSSNNMNGKKHSEITKKKISESLKKKYESQVLNRKLHILDLYKNNWNQLVMEFGVNVWKKFILAEQNGKCLFCGIDSWMNKPITLHLDHIDGNDKNNNRDNLRILCPNCHSQTDTYGFKKRK